MSINTDQPVWALADKTTKNFATTAKGIRTFVTRTDARTARSDSQRVVKLQAANRGAGGA